MLSPDRRHVLNRAIRQRLGAPTQGTNDMNDTTKRTVELTDAEARLIETLLQSRQEIATPGPTGTIFRSARRAILPAIVETPTEQRRKTTRPSKRDALDRMEREFIATATEFVASLFLGTGQWAKYDAKTLSEARALADRLRTENPLCSRRPLVYAILPNGSEVLVPADYQPST